MEKIEATFRIVTPMFIGGADHSVSDGIRPPSVKGALRFWWRALSWEQYYQREKNSDNALKEIRAEEARLFGHASAANEGGQGTFLLTTEHKFLKTENPPSVHSEFKSKSAAGYLGYGLMVAFGQKSGQLERGCISENQTFIVKLIFKNEIDDSIVAALKILGLLGGLGSRSRHGMGSVAIEKITFDKRNEWRAPTAKETYRKEVKMLLGDFEAAPLPEYSAFSANTRVDCLLSSTTPYEVLNQFGKSMLMYRSWGREGKVLYEDSEKRFKNDHDWFRNVNDFRNNEETFHPERVVFGLPHNYDKDVKHHVTPKVHERRGSPLFFHVHRLNNKEYIGVSVLLKSLFLPEKEKINVGGRSVDQNINWEVITSFLDDKIGNPPSNDDRFPQKESILP